MLKSLSQYVFDTQRAGDLGLLERGALSALAQYVLDLPDDQIPTTNAREECPIRWRVALWILALARWVPPSPTPKENWSPDRLLYLGSLLHMRGVFPSGPVLYSAITGVSTERAEMLLLFVALAANAAMDAGQSRTLSFNLRKGGKGHYVTLIPAREDFPVWARAMGLMGRVLSCQRAPALQHDEVWIEPNARGFALNSLSAETGQVIAYRVRFNPKASWDYAPRVRVGIKVYDASGSPEDFPEVVALLRHLAMVSEGAAEFPFEVRGTPAQWADLVVRFTQDAA